MSPTYENETRVVVPLGLDSFFSRLLTELAALEKEEKTDSTAAYFTD